MPVVTAPEAPTHLDARRGVLRARVAQPGRHGGQRLAGRDPARAPPPRRIGSPGRRSSSSWRGPPRSASGASVPWRGPATPWSSRRTPRSSSTPSATSRCGRSPTSRSAAGPSRRGDVHPALGRVTPAAGDDVPLARRVRHGVPVADRRAARAARGTGLAGDAAVVRVRAGGGARRAATATDVADLLGTTKQAAAKVVGAMEADGLLRRAPHRGRRAGQGPRAHRRGPPPARHRRGGLRRTGGGVGRGDRSRPGRGDPPGPPDRPAAGHDGDLPPIRPTW